MLHKLITICFFYILLCPKINGQNTFNYEIAGRVIDQISAFSNVVSRGLNVPLQQIKAKNVPLNFYDEDNVMVSLLYPVKLVFNDVAGDIFIGFEDGFWYGYIGQFYEVNNNTLPITNESIANNLPRRFTDNYETHSNGSKGAYVSSALYDCRLRVWYQTTKRLQVTSWIGPFISLARDNFFPTLTFASPIYEKTNNVSVFKGVIGANIYLATISAFLQETYTGIRKVYIVDALGGGLIATSIPEAAVSYVTPTGGQGVLLAVNSENEIIRESFKLLKSKNFLEELVIFQDYYLQSTMYTDVSPGIKWRVIVLLPATLQVNSLSKGHPYYITVVVVAALALGVSVVCFIITVVFRNYRLFRLIQPQLILTVLSGCILLSISCFLSLGDNTNTRCATLPFIFNLGYSLTIVPLGLKAVRVYFLFIANPLTIKTQNIRMNRVFGYTFMFLLIDVIILTSSIYSAENVNPVSEDTELTANGAFATVIYCTHSRNGNLLKGEIAFKALIMFITCVYSYLIRNVHSHVAGSRVIVLIAYNMAFISIVIILVVELTAVINVPLSVLIKAIGISYVVISIAASLVLPSLYQIWMLGDAASANEVIEQLFDKSNKTHHKGSLDPSCKSHFCGKSHLQSGKYSANVDQSAQKMYPESSEDPNCHLTTPPS
mmetsp:Transcript_26536/g.25396  ORF Transcript_26536/g.25396 Transcript_26536/m.25396 type:complete len:661 (-) Transcript_26536:426-2408(-)